MVISRRARLRRIRRRLIADRGRTGRSDVDARDCLRRPRPTTRRRDATSDGGHGSRTVGGGDVEHTLANETSARRDRRVEECAVEGATAQNQQRRVGRSEGRGEIDDGAGGGSGGLDSGPRDSPRPPTPSDSRRRPQARRPGASGRRRTASHGDARDRTGLQPAPARARRIAAMVPALAPTTAMRMEGSGMI